MKKYRYLLFDLDGTLVHSHPGIFAGIRYALKEMGRADEPTDEYLRQCIGPSLVYSFSNFFGMNEKDAQESTAKYRAWYSVDGLFRCTPIDGALQALKTLKGAGYVLAMATSKPKTFADKIAKRLGFSEYLSVQVGCGLDGSFPTKASVIEEAVRQLGADKAECLMIGDRKHDAEGAKEQGVDCALLGVGYAAEGEFAAAQPRYVFKNFEDLTAFLTKK
ncbi:MAG: HAD hydrolase-like protein [Clostridia bacterium]|nr:HAD hydrolase-like protein [Clostridia bacterium]